MEVKTRNKSSIMTMEVGSYRYSSREYYWESCCIVNDFMCKECYFKFENVIKFEDSQ